MKNIFSKLALFCISAALVVGCSEYDFNEGGDTSSGNNGNTTDKNIGKLSLNIKAITDDIEVVKGSENEPLIPLDEFLVSIKDSDGAEVFNSTVAEVPEVIGLPIADGYKVIVTGGEDQSAAFDSPYYYGESEFKIVQVLINTVNVESSLANTKISLNITDEFIAAYGTDWKIIIRNDEYVESGDQQLVYTNDNYWAIGYVRSSALIVKVIAGSVEKSYEINNVEAAEHHIVSVDVIGSGAMKLNLSINSTLVEKDQNIDVPNNDETLGNGGVEQPDFVPEGGGSTVDPVLPAAPTVSGEGFDIDEVLVYNKTNPAIDKVVGVITAEGGIKNLIVTINSSDAINATLPAVFGGNSFDMANPTDKQKANLITFGILKEGEQIKGSTGTVLDVTQFMSLLDENNGKAHEFNIEVIDNNDLSVNKTMSIKIEE